MAVGVMHVESVLALAIWFLIAERLRALSFSTVLGGVALAATFHAIYNLLVSKPGVSTVLGYIYPPAIALTMFLLYRLLRPQFERVNGDAS